MVVFICSSAQAQNLFVSDNSSGNIYEFTPDGTQSTFASGLCYPAGLAFNSAGNLFVANAAAATSMNLRRAERKAPLPPGWIILGLAFNSAGDLFVADGSQRQHL